MTRRRISLRSLLLLTVAVAISCWYRDLPRQNASRFITAFNSDDQAVIDSLFDAEIRCGTIIPFVQRHGEFTAALQPQSLGEWFKGKHCIVFHTRDNWLHDGYAIAAASGITRWQRYSPCEPLGPYPQASRGRQVVRKATQERADALTSRPQWDGVEEEQR